MAEVTRLIKSRQLEDALIILEHTPKRAAITLRKLLVNAQNTAKTVHKLKPDSLVVQEIFANKGLTLKRRKLSQTTLRNGRGGRRYPLPFNHQFSHVFLIVSGQIKPASKPAKPKSEVKSKTQKKVKE